MIIICFAKIIIKIALDSSKKKLELNEHIHFSNCLSSIKTRLLFLFFYGQNNDDVNSDILRLVQNIRATTIKYEPDRNFERISHKPEFKWYRLRYSSKSKNKNSKNKKKIKEN